MNGKRLLLHICCAPDATVPWPSLIGEGCETAGYFYGGNIHPREEYDRRAAAVSALAGHTGAQHMCSRSLFPFNPPPLYAGSLNLSLIHI